MVDLVAQSIKSGKMVIIHVFSDGEISTSSQEKGEGTIIRDLIAKNRPQPGVLDGFSVAASNERISQLRDQFDWCESGFRPLSTTARSNRRRQTKRQRPL